MQTVRDKAAALRSGGGAAGWAPVLIAMCSLGCCLLVIALVILLSLIPTMVTDDTVAAKKVTSKTSSVTTTVADARRKRVTTSSLGDYIGDQVGPSCLAQIKKKMFSYVPSKHITDLTIISSTLGIEANTDSTMILTTLFTVLFGDDCGKEGCQDITGDATQKAFEAMPASVFTCYSVPMYTTAGALAGYATVLRGSKIIHVSKIRPWYSSQDSGVSPSTKSMTTASMTTASG
ncbi:unnamed protein product [Adineta steineri]|uniref:Uncharacterized protein n=1 Tax=Adineta steineri TaxID=433720 RepID=A0A813N9K8_9BILA|nr:unnamed protein product [Adineta steineri]